ncbi:TonB-dependent receptor [Pedobacter nototheniae]|uniref:TonB-dependent receptor n=1 Tax=Pedobacter nototheniae TaxID=2488994 RepID=UPI00292EA18F|nr:TonB-dependent receptor [Pedobacter nototheniae]
MLKIFMLCCSVFLTLGTYAQKYNLHINITDTTNKALKGAKIRLFKPLQEEISDHKGIVDIELTSGTYTLECILNGYLTVNQKVEISVQNINLSITLHRMGFQLNDITINDKRQEERRRTESLTIEVVKSDFIRQNLGGSLMQTLERLPGIKTIGIGSGQSKPLIRGLGFNRVVVVDKGIKHEGQQWGADHGLEIDQFAADEVELLKGAASFAYGSDAIAGAINIKPATVPAAESIGGSIDLIGKSNNNLYGTSVNLYARKQKYFFDLRATDQNYGDYRVPADTLYVYDYAVPLYKNHLRNTAGRETGLHFSSGYIGQKFRSIFYISNLYSKSGFFANAHGLEPRRVDTELHDSNSRDVLMPSQRVNHFKFSNRTTVEHGLNRFEAEIGYQRNFRQEFNHYVNHGYMPAIYPVDLGIPIDMERQFDKSVYTLNLREKLLLGAHQLMFGLNGEIQKNQINGWSFLVPAFNQQSAGAFIHDKLKLSERVLLQGALRYDYTNLSMFRYADWFYSELVSNQTTSSQQLIRSENLQRNFNSLVWSVGINYVTEEVELKGNLGKSFRVPIAKELGANGVNYHYFSYEKGNSNLDPEQSYQLDASVLWKREKFSVQFSPFVNYFPNYIYLNPTSKHDYFYGAGNQVFQYAQSCVFRYGGELQLKSTLTNNLSAEVLAEYLYAKQLSGDKKGYTLPFSPPASVLWNLTYKRKSGTAHPYLSIDYRLTAAQNNIVPPERKTSSYSLFNIQAGTSVFIAKQQANISLQVQNVFNTRYLNHTSFYRLIGLPEQGRNLVLSLRIPFNLRKQLNH